jgi:hypothetical protein
MTPQEKEAVVERLWKRMVEANGVILARIGEKLPGLYKIRLNKVEQDSQAMIWREAARELLDIVESAGYATPPKNDLRGQLLRAARELKAHSFHRGYSSGPEDEVDDKVAEARAEAISDVGDVLLRALTDES